MRTATPRTGKSTGRTAQCFGMRATAGHGKSTLSVATHAVDLSSASKARQQIIGFKQHSAPVRNIRGLSLVTKASDSTEVEAAGPSTFQKVSDLLSNLFPVWTVLSAGLALSSPGYFSFLSTEKFTMLLGLLMFSMGITLTVEDFKRVLSRPGVVGIGFIMCYVMMPLLAFAIGKIGGFTAGLLAGLVLVGSINGGQASNLCTYIAKGDVALSVIMTTSTTIGCIFMTPLLAKVLLGAIVPVDAAGIAISTVQVVLAPIAVGVLCNTFFYDLCRKIEPICPLIGVASTVLLVGGSVAQCSDAILNAGIAMQLACISLHVVGGIIGFAVNKAMGYSETVCRTTAIETAMKSSAFGFLLAVLHFADATVRVVPAISVVWMAVTGSTLAVIWRFIPVPDEEETTPATSS